GTGRCRQDAQGVRLPAQRSGARGVHECKVLQERARLDRAGDRGGVPETETSPSGTGRGKSYIMSDQQPKRYKMVRVTEATHSRLSRFRDHLFRLYQECRFELPDDQVEHLSLSWVIEELMNRVLAHRNRAKRQRASKVTVKPK